MLLWLLCLLFPLAFAQAAPRFLCCDHNGWKVCVGSADGKVEWEHLCRNPQNCRRLANRDSVLRNHPSNGHHGQQPHCFEITPDKKPVWQFANHAQLKTVNHILLPDAPGDAR